MVKENIMHFIRRKTCPGVKLKENIFVTSHTNCFIFPQYFGNNLCLGIQRCLFEGFLALDYFYFFSRETLISMRDLNFLSYLW